MCDDIQSEGSDGLKLEEDDMPKNDDSSPKSKEKPTINIGDDEEDWNKVILHLMKMLEKLSYLSFDNK